VIDRKEVELLVRANLGSSKQQLSGLAKSIGDVEASIDRQVGAAKRGEVSIDELKASLAALGIAQEQLKGKADLIGQFERQAGAIQKAQERVEKTSKAYADYKAKLDAASEVTDKQQEKLIKLSASHDRAQQALQRQQATQVQLTQSLRDAGIATTELAEAENKVRTAAAQIGVAMAKTSQAITTYADDVRKARQAEKELTENNAFEQKLADAAKLAKSADYVLTWERALEQAEAAEKRLKADTSLRKQADDAQAATLQYQTLARAAADLTPKIVSLKDAVASILNPSGAARSTLAGVEAEVKKLAASVAEIKGPVKDYEASFKSLTSAQKALIKQAGLIDTFRQQAAGLRTARAEFVAARAEVTQYAAAVRQGGDSGEKFTKALADAQNRARLASAALRDQLTATRAARDGLRDAGIATNDLAGAETRLANTARATVGAVQGLTAAVDQYGQATTRARKGGGLFGDEGRTTLSLAQRFRGEILALASAYVGLQGSISLAKGSLDAFNARASIKSILGVSLDTTNRETIDAEYAYVKGQSDRIGLVFDKTAEQFAKFSVAAAKSGRSRQEIRFIFESFAEAGRVMNLTGEQTERVFKALEQIFSKGKIGAEELRQQLGDSGLAGVFEVAQQALKKQFPDLNKAMQEGKVGVENLVLIAEAYRKMVGEQLPAAQKTLAAEQARVNNAVFDFKNAIADAGFADEFRKALIEITNFLKSEQGAKFAQGLSAKFTLVAKGIVLILENIDLLIAAATTFFGIWALGRVNGMVEDLKKLKDAAGGAGTSIKSIGGAVGIAQAALIGWQIGTILSDKFDIVKKAGAAMVFALNGYWATIKAAFGFAFDAVPIIAKNVFVDILNAATFFVRKLLGVFGAIAKAAGMDTVVAELEKVANALTVTTTGGVAAAFEKRREQLKKEIAADREIFRQQLADIDNPPVAAVAPKAVAGQTASPGKTSGKTGPTEAEINKRARAIEAIKSALEAIDARIDKSNKDLLQPQLDAIDAQFQHLKRQIEKLGGPESKKFLDELVQLTFQAKQDVLRKFNDGIGKEQEAITRKLEAVDAAAGRKSKFELQERLNAISTGYEATYRQIADFRQKLIENNRDPEPADRAKERLDAGVAELKQLELRKFATEELARREKLVTEEIEARDKRIAAVRAQLEVGKIDSGEAADQINAINAQAVPGIQAAAAATREWALAHETIFANPEQMAAFLAVLDATALKATQVKTEFDAIGKTVVSGGLAALNTGIEGIVNSLGEMFKGQKSVAEGFKDIARGAAGVFAKFLQDIAVAIIKLQIFNLMKQSGNPIIAAIGTAGAASVGVNHAGGIIGRPSNRMRRVNPAMFANAPRYHEGGFAGLRPNEVPAILEKNEEVLDKNNPRNALNGGLLGGGQQGGSKGQRVVLVDDRSKIPEAMSSAEGEDVIVQTIRRNIPTIKQMMR
jgi:tape measure domain-containing protein